MSTPSYPQREYAPEDGATSVLLVRHGQSASYVPGKPFALIDGQGDPPLSERGQWQAEQVAARLASEPVAAIYATSLRRTAQTATPLARMLDMTIDVESDLREVHLGVGERGHCRQMVAENHPQVREMRRLGEWGAIEGAESNAELIGRCGPAIERIAAAHPDQLAVVVCHGGVIAALMSMVTGTPQFTFSGVRNASFTLLERAGLERAGLDQAGAVGPGHVGGPGLEGVDGSPVQRWTVRSYNDAAHVGTVLADAEPPS